MTTARLNKVIGDIVEQKLLEFFGDPDAGLEVRKGFLADLQKSMKKKNRKLTSHADVLKKIWPPLSGAIRHLRILEN